MGNACWPCLEGSTANETPDQETRRRQLAEAAEKRQEESNARGLKDPEGAARRRKQMEEQQDKLQNSAESTGTGLKWQVG
uniref:small VCP/p97-interacting protein-like n=1 Tax=Myxine glutinosa TaxID=7769 RepID=UPI00358EE008